MVVLSKAGDQLPLIPLFEVVGKADNVVPEQMAATGVNVGVTGLFTVIVIVAVVAHWPAAGVNVYVVVEVLLIAGDQLPDIPFSEVVGSVESTSPEQIAGTCVNTGVAKAMSVTVFDALAGAQPPAAAIVFVMVYTPGILAARSISPVDEFAKTKPAGDAENSPALEPGPNTGKGFAADWQ